MRKYTRAEERYGPLTFKRPYHPLPICKNCKWARKAENENYVGCAATLVTDKIDYTNDDDLFEFYKRKEVAIGWVDLRTGINGKSSGMLTNGIPCFKPDDSCDHFEYPED
jgi:hypothetical protein